MKSLLVVTAIMLMASQAWGESWVEYGGNDYFEAFIDTDTLTVKEDVAIFWTKWSLSPKGKANMFGKNKRLSKNAATMKMKWLAICNGADAGIAEMANYTYDKKGNVLESIILNAPKSHDIVPGSLMESMHSAVCGLVNVRNQVKASQVMP